MIEPNIRLTKIFTFEMAHALLGYDGACSNIHGHSYKLHVTIIGKPKKDVGHPKDGMVIDFKNIKKIVKSNIIDKYDHALLLNERVDHEQKKVLQQAYNKVIFTADQPSCELMIVEFSNVLKEYLTGDVELFSIKLYETESSYAEWFASDQL